MPDEMLAGVADHAERHLRRHHRRAEACREFTHRRGGNARRPATGHHTAADDDQWTARRTQQRAGGRHCTGGRTRPLRGAIARGRDVELAGGEFARSQQHVLRHIEMHGARPPGQGLAKRAPHQFGNAPRVVHHGIPFGHRLHYREGVEVHEHAAVRVRRSAMLVGGDGDQGKVVVERPAHTGGEIERSRPHFAQRQRNAPAAGVDRGGHHWPARFMAQAGKGEARLLVDRLQERRQLSADDAERMRYAFGHQSAHQRLCAIDGR